MAQSEISKAIATLIAERDELDQAINILVARYGGENPTTRKSKGKSKGNKKAVSSDSGSVPVKGKRKMTPAARRRLSEKMKSIHAEKRALQAKAERSAKSSKT